MKHVRMLLLGMMLLSACGGVRAGNPQPPPSDFEGLAGRVLASGSAARPLAGVTVRVGDRTAVTDEFGFWRMPGDMGKSDTLAISVRHGGYAPYVQVLPRRQALGRFVTTSLRPVAASKRISVAEGGVVVVPASGTGNAAAVRIAPNSLKFDAKEVDVAVSIVRPEVPAELAAFPGEYLGKADDLLGGQDLLRTLGTLDVSFSVNGEALDTVELSEPARLQMALDDEYGAEFAEGATIPTWWLDPASGAWMGEGSARVIMQNDRKLASWSASHFTWWNLDQPLQTHACYAVRLVAADEATKLALQGMLLTIAGVDYAGTSRASSFSEDGLAVVTGWRGHKVRPSLQFAGAESGGFDRIVGAMLWGADATFALPLTNASTLSGKGPEGGALVPEKDCLYREYPFALMLGKVEGRVYDEYAKPLSGAVVVLAEMGRAVVSAADGSYVFLDVPYATDGRVTLTVAAMPPAHRGEIYFDDVPVVRDHAESRADLIALVRETPPVLTSVAVSNSYPPVKATIDFAVSAGDAGAHVRWAVKACGQTLTVESKTADADPAKTVLCHLPPGNPANAQTIAVGSDAAAAHLAHGDIEGACAGRDPNAPPTVDDAGDKAVASGACSLSRLTASSERSGSGYVHRLTGKWTGDKAEAHTLSIAAKDWLGYQSQQNRTIAWKNNPPVLFWDPPKYGRINDFISVDGFGDDADGDPVAVQWTFNGVAGGVGEKAVLGPVVDGPNYIVALVSDGRDTVSQRYVVYGTVLGSIMAPDTVLTGTPDSPSSDTTPTFTFASPLSSATFECRLDGGAWGACVSPHTASVTTVGIHTFAVRAVDALGRYDATPAFASWDLFLGWRNFSLGNKHSCGIYNDGVLACWGSNGWGQLGYGYTVTGEPTITPPYFTQPTIIPHGPQRWLTVAAGFKMNGSGGYSVPLELTEATCGIADDRSLWCWGRNRGFALIGFGDPITVPAKIGADQDWLDVQVANDMACALKQDRSLHCWGEGQLPPDPRTGDGADVVRNAPHPVTGGIVWATYSLGVDEVCGIAMAGGLYCWGRSGPSGATVPTPALINAESDWAAVSVGRDHACALKTDHTLWCWGDNFYHQLGAVGPDAVLPVQVSGNDWLHVSAAATSTCALKLDRTLWCWGTDMTGSFGGPFITWSGVVVYTSPTLVSPDTDWDSVQHRIDATCASKQDRSLYCWGRNRDSNLGAGLAYLAPYLRRIDAPAFVTLSEQLNLTRCGVDYQGAVWCAGQNSMGQAGYAPSGFLVYEFYRLPGVQAWEAVGTGRAGGAATCALETGGTMYCWGYEQLGQFGDGPANTVSSTPVIAGGSKQWLSFSMGYASSCAIDTATTMWCWGSNAFLQSGAVTSTSVVDAPNALPGTGWSKVQATANAACGLKNTELFCWGQSLSIVFGYAASAPSSMTPLAVTPGRSWSDLSFTDSNVCAIDTTGALWCWGEALNGHYPNGSSVPVAVSIDTDWLRVYVGAYHACALKANGTLWCFGDITLVEGMPSDGTVWQIGTDTDWQGYYPGSGEVCALKINGEMWCRGEQSYGQWGDGGLISFAPQRVLEPQKYR